MKFPNLKKSVRLKLIISKRCYFATLTLNAGDQNNFLGSKMEKTFVLREVTWVTL